MQPELNIEEVKHRAIRGVIALTGRTAVLQIINSTAFIILAGILSPSQIGVFVVVNAVIRIFNLFTDVGLGAALIQKKDTLQEEDLKAAFTMQEILIVLIVALGFILTPHVQLWAKLNDSGVTLYHVLLVILFISSLKVIPSILMERKLAFEKQIIPQLVEALVFDVLVVALAIKGFGIASYSWSFLISALAGLPIYYLISPWKIRLGLSREHAKQLLSYGLAYQGKSLLAVIKDDLLTFFLSGIVGPAGVGYWGTAQKFAYFPYRFIVDSITKVTFPAYSRIHHDLQALRGGIEKSLFATSLVLFPILTMFAVLAQYLILVFPRYRQWGPSLPSLYLLCAQAAIAGLTNILVNVLDATGRVRTTLWLMVMWIIGTWLLTIFAVSKIGFTGIALAAFAVSLTIFVVIYLVKRIVNFNFLASIWQPVFGSLAMGFSLILVLHRLPVNIFSIILAVFLGCIIYTGVLILIARQELMTNIRTLIRVYKKSGQPEEFSADNLVNKIS